MRQNDNDNTASMTIQFLNSPPVPPTQHLINNRFNNQVYIHIIVQIQLSLITYFPKDPLTRMLSRMITGLNGGKREIISAT